MFRPSLAFALVALLSRVAPLAAQDGDVDRMIAVGDSLWKAFEPESSLAVFRRAFTLERDRFEVLRGIARAQIDIARQLEGGRTRALRDSLFWVAELYAEAAIRADSTQPDGYFFLANALGRLSLTRGGRERVRYARRIYDLAAQALAIDPDHDGAHHVLAMWHAEIRRLSGLTRTVARTLLGAGFMDRASWDSAVVHMEAAVALRPEYLFHRLELARIYRDSGRPEDARRELETVLALPPTTDLMDRRYQSEARELLGELGVSPPGGS